MFELFNRIHLKKQMCRELQVTGERYILKDICS